MRYEPVEGTAGSVSPLRAVEDAFDALAALPGQFGVPGRLIAPEDGDAAVGLGEVRTALLRPGAVPVIADRVWRFVLWRVRAGDPQWEVVAVGLAAPGLRALLRRVACPALEREELEQEALVGFVAGLRRVDPDQPWVCAQLLRSADNAVHRAAYAAEQAARRRAWAPALELVRAPATDGIEAALSRAVASGLVDPADAELIAATRLERLSLRDAGRRLGHEQPTGLLLRRRAAEARLARALRQP